MSKYFFLFCMVLSLQAMEKPEEHKQESSGSPSGSFARRLASISRGLRNSPSSPRKKPTKSDQLNVDDLKKTLREVFPDISEEDLAEIVQ